MAKGKAHAPHSLRLVVVMLGLLCAVAVIAGVRSEQAAAKRRQQQAEFERIQAENEQSSKALIRDIQSR